MQRNQFWPATRRALSILALTLVLVSGAAGGRYKVLHNFNCPTDGCGSYAGLIFDARGNLYGTTLDSVFELTPGSRGWTLNVLHMFSILSEGQDIFAGVTFDAAGNLYSTAIGGGAYDYGTVFELIPGFGGWTLTVLHSFNVYDGRPFAGVVLDKTGNLYGTTQGEIAYELTPSSGGWTESVIHNFAKGNDGLDPEAGLTWDATGNLYGTTRWGGGYYKNCTAGCGTVFELSPTSGGGWKEHELHRFNWVPGGPDGYGPYAPVVFDGVGNLYGTTAAGGSSNGCQDGCGTVFKLTPLSNGRWKETILYSFGPGTGGSAPFAGVVLDKAGNLYGTTQRGGINNAGVVFKLALGSNGKWVYSVLHRFTGPDGAQSNAGLIFDKAGKHLYGTTSLGGAHNGGVVFEITP